MFDWSTFEFVELNPGRYGGQPCIAGSRLPLAQLLAELAEGDRTLNAIARDFDLNPLICRAALGELASRVSIGF